MMTIPRTWSDICAPGLLVACNFVPVEQNLAWSHVYCRTSSDPRDVRDSPVLVECLLFKLSLVDKLDHIVVVKILNISGTLQNLLLVF